MRGHANSVDGVAFFNDGRRVVTGSQDKTLNIWNAQKGTLLGEPLLGHQGSVSSVAVSPDDSRVASGGQDNTVIIWDVERKQIVFRLVKHTGWVNSVCFSPDGKRLASGSIDGTAVIWDTETGTVLTTLEVRGFWVLSVAFSPDGLKLASATLDGIIRVFHTDNVELVLLEFKAHALGVCGIVWSPDGQQLISASWDKTIKFWNSSTGCQVGQPCTGHTEWICSLAIASDGSFIATASHDKTVRLWSTKTYQQTGQPLWHSHTVLRVAISTNGALLASGAGGGNIYLWSIGNTLQRQEGQEGYKEELEVEQKPRISQIVALPTPPAESNTHERTNSSSAPPSLEMSATLLEIKQERELALDKDEESAEDDEILDQQLPYLYVKQSPSTGPQGRMVHPDAQSSISLGLASETISAPQVSFVQVESDSHSSVPAEAILQDLTASITKIGDFPVARGGFGEVWKCIYHTDLGPTDVAVKSLLVYASDQNGEGIKKKTKRIRRELKTCARLNHPNILPVYGYTYGFGLLMAIVSPWAKNGNLTTYLEDEDATLTFVGRFEVLRDVASGLQYLHANNIIHGDLNGPNVLIHGDGTACLADFGLSLMYSEVITTSAASWTSEFHGNFRWLAPELLGEPEDELPVRPSKRSDIYSFGGIMLHVITSKTPYYYLSEAAVTRCIYSGVKPSRSRYPAFSDNYWCFIEECWSTEPLDRPSADRVVEVIIYELYSVSSSSAGT